MSSMDCPKCGHPQPQSETCSKCGVIIGKYMAALERRQAQQPQPAAPSGTSPVDGNYVKFIAILVTALLVTGFTFAKDSPYLPSPIRKIIPRSLFSKNGNIYGTTKSGKNLYINYLHGFSLEIPENWHTFTPKEAIEAPLILEMFGDMYYYITGPDGPNGTVLHITKASFESDTFSFTRHVNSMTNPAYWTRVFDNVSDKNGLTIYRFGAILKSEDTYREDAIINTPGGMMEIYFLVRNQSSNPDKILLMREVTESLKKV